MTKGLSLCHVGQLSYTTLSYKRIRGATDLVFAGEFGSDAVCWTSGFIVSTVDNFDGSETVTVWDHTPEQDLGGRRFVRVKVTAVAAGS